MRRTIFSIGVLVACGEARASGKAPCGFSDFAALDAATWAAAQNYNYKVERTGKVGPKWPAGGPPPLGPPPAVGSCRLHAIDPLITRYELRDGERKIAQLTLCGTMVQIPGINVDGVSVGMSSDVVLARYPSGPYRLECAPTGLGDMCELYPSGKDDEPKVSYLVTGTLRDRVKGAAALAFFRHKPILGIHVITRC